MSTGNDQTILIVEDEAVIAMSESLILEKNGFRVLTADGAEKAFHILDEQPVDLILMDIDLGRDSMTGTEAAEIILGRYEFPIVFCTSHSEKEMVEKVKGITRYGYVLKSAGEFVLIESINMAFELFRTYKHLVRENEERKTVELALMENQARLQIISDISSDYAYCHKLNLDGSLEPVWHIGSFDHITGYTPEELYEKGGWGTLIHPDDIPGAERYIQELLSGRPAEFTARIVTKSGDIRWIHDSGRPWCEGKSGKIIGTFGSAEDVTSRKEMEVELEKNSAELSAIYEHTPVLTLLLDREWRVRKANAFAAGFAGTPVEELMGRRSGEVLRCIHNLDDPRGCGFGIFCTECRVRGIVRETFEDGASLKKSEMEVPSMENDRVSNHSFLVSTVLLERDDEELCLISFEDITERRQKENALRESESLYRNLMENSIDAIYLLNEEGKVLNVNQIACRMLGYAREELLERTIDDIDPNFPSAKFISFWKEKPEGSTVLFESLHQKKSGEIIPVEVNGIFFRLHNVKYLFGVARDISERKEEERKLTEKEQNFRALAENAGVGITIIQDDKMRYVNSAATKISAFSREEMLSIGISGMLELIHPEDRGFVAERYREQTGDFESGNTTPKTYPPITYRHVRKDGTVVWIETFSSIIGFNGEPALLVLHNDISDRRKSEGRIRQLLAEKEVILKESHHRIKNNMEVIRSLITLQPDSPELTAGAVRSMMLLYDKLYRSENYDSLSVKDFLPPLVDEVMGIFKAIRPVQVSVRVEDVVLSSKMLSSLGIIINELISNSMKYAFENVDDPAITVVVSRSENSKNNVILVYEDNGLGISVSDSSDDRTGFGMQLVKILVEQIDGTLSIESDGCTRIIISFEIP